MTLVPAVPAEHLPERALSSLDSAWLVTDVLPPQSHDVLGRAEI